MTKGRESLPLGIKHLNVICWSLASLQSSITSILTLYHIVSHAKLWFSLRCPAPLPETFKVLNRWDYLNDVNGVTSMFPTKMRSVMRKVIFFSWLSLVAASLLSFYLESLANANTSGNWIRAVQRIFNRKLCNWESSHNCVTGLKHLNSLGLCYLCHLVHGWGLCTTTIHNPSISHGPKCYDSKLLRGKINQNYLYSLSPPPISKNICWIFWGFFSNHFLSCLVDLELGGWY